MSAPEEEIDETPYQEWQLQYKGFALCEASQGGHAAQLEYVP